MALSSGARSRKARAPQSWRVAAALCALSGALGCGGVEVDLPIDFTATSEHFVYHTRSDTPLCAATLPALESHFEATRRLLGFPWPEGRKVEYFRYRDDADLRASRACGDARGDGGRGCADAKTRKPVVYSAWPVQRHELVHAYLAPLGFPHAIYAEGLAELLKCESVPVARRGPERDWRVALFRREAGAFAAYEEAALLARRLWDRFGPQKILDVYATSRHGLGPEAFGEEFARLFAASLDEVWGETLALVPGAGLHTICPCDGVVVPTDGLPPTMDACPVRDVERPHVFELSAPSVLRIESWAGLPYPDNSPRACPGTTPPPGPLGVEPGLDTWGATVGALGPGRYYLSRLDDARVTAWEGRLGLSCEAASLQALRSGTYYGNLRVSAEAGGNDRLPGATRYVAFDLSTPQRFAGVRGAFSICGGCAGASCQEAAEAFAKGQEISGRLVFAVPAGGEAELRLNAEPCDGPCRGAGPGCPRHCGAAAR